MELNSKAFGLATGIFTGGFWLVVGGLSLLTGVARQAIKVLGGFHPGFSYSWPGLIWLSVTHLIGGFVLGWLFAILYNWLVRKWK